MRWGHTLALAAGYAWVWALVGVVWSWVLGAPIGDWALIGAIFGGSVAFLLSGFIGLQSRALEHWAVESFIRRPRGSAFAGLGIVLAFVGLLAKAALAIF